jgi:hypothetical protein
MNKASFTQSDRHILMNTQMKRHFLEHLDKDPQQKLRVWVYYEMDIYTHTHTDTRDKISCSLLSCDILSNHHSYLGAVQLPVANHF